MATTISNNYVDFKVVLLGREYCGKTSLVERFLKNRFVGDNLYQNTIGAAYGARRMTVSGRTIVMGIWDTAGSERYEAMSRIYYRNARAALVCYDVTDPESFERVRFWITELAKNSQDSKIYIVATKCDLEQQVVDSRDAQDLAHEFSAKVFETSAKTGHNVKELFQDIAKEYAEDPLTSLTQFDRKFFRSPSLTEKFPSIKCCSGSSS